MSVFKEIIKKYFRGQYNQKTIRYFASWLDDKENQELKDEALRELWDNTKTEADESTLVSFQKFRENNMVVQRPQKKVLNALLTKKWVSAAAILLLPLLSAAITYSIIQSNSITKNQTVEFVEYVVPNGEIRNIHLPDSSHITLNAGSILILPKDFAKNERTVYLSGEAYFEVFHDKERPFRVKTSDIDIEVLGTTFNVTSYHMDKLSSTILKEGKVKVYVKEEQTEHILSPGEQIRYDRHTKTAMLVSETQDAFAWLDGNLSISKASIEEIVENIERKYGVNVYLSSMKFREEKITMNLVNNENLEECMDILYQIVPNLEYRIENKNVFIY